MTRLIGRYGRRFLPLFLACVALMVIRVACELALPSMMGDIVDAGVYEGDTAYILHAGIWMVVWSAVAMIADITNAFTSAHASMGMSKQMRGDIYRRVSSYSQSEMDRFGTASLITRTTNDVQQVERFTHMCMTIALMSPIKLIGSIIASLATSTQLALVVLATAPVVVGLVFLIMRSAMPLLRSLQVKVDNLNRVAREGLTGIRVIRAYRREKHEEERFSKANHDLAETNVRVARRVSLLTPLITLVLNLAVVVMVWAGAGFVESYSLEVGELMAVVQYVAQVLISVIMLSVVFLVWPRASAAAERIETVLATEPSVTDPVDATTPLPGTDGARTVRFEHVDFAFPGAEAPTLDDVSFELAAGRSYALIGPTGSGKSTIAELVLRFHDPTSGRITIDGIDIATVPLDDLHRSVSYVPQRTTLFTGTIADNIRYGKPDATDEEVESAALAAAALDFIEEREDGFDTRLSQAATGLSGGQRQRIAIARALVRDTGLYVFDDSLSALDFRTESVIRRNLSARTSKATTLTISQRISVARDADEVIVIDDGRVLAQGSHDRLLQTSDVYRQIVSSQIRNAEVR